MRDKLSYKLCILFVLSVSVLMLFVVSMYSIDDSATIDMLILYNWVIKGILIGLIMLTIVLLFHPYRIVL